MTSSRWSRAGATPSPACRWPRTPIAKRARSNEPFRDRRTSRPPGAGGRPHFCEKASPSGVAAARTAGAAGRRSRARSRRRRPPARRRAPSGLRWSNCHESPQHCVPAHRQPARRPGGLRRQPHHPHPEPRPAGVPRGALRQRLRHHPGVCRQPGQLPHRAVRAPPPVHLPHPAAAQGVQR